MSDLHGQLLDNIEPVDILIIAGDICPVTNHHTYYQINWLDTTFRYWLNSLPAKQIIFVAGNHDWCFQLAPQKIPKDLKAHYLQDSYIDIEGIRVYGSPFQPWFLDWAFNAPKVNGEAFLYEKYKNIPADTTIVVSHGPPAGYGDLVPEDLKGSPNKGQHVGSTSLLNRIKEIKPLLVVTGHLHSGTGVYEYTKGKFICNAAVLDEEYQLVKDPFYFTFEDGKMYSHSPPIISPAFENEKLV